MKSGSSLHSKYSTGMPMQPVNTILNGFWLQEKWRTDGDGNYADHERADFLLKGFPKGFARQQQTTRFGLDYDVVLKGVSRQQQKQSTILKGFWRFELQQKRRNQARMVENKGDDDEDVRPSIGSGWKPPTDQYREFHEKATSDVLLKSFPQQRQTT